MALLALAAAAGTAHFVSPSSVSASTWANAGSSWFAPANWIGGVPDLTHGATLPASASIFNPNIGSSTANAQTLSIDNSGGGIYSISNTVTNGTTIGTLTLGTGGLSNTGGGTSNLNIALAIIAPTTFTINTNTRTALIGKFYGGSATNTLTKAGAGTLDLQQDAPTTGTMTVNVNAGILEVRNSASLGAAPNITVTSATFQLDPALSYPSGVATVGPMFFGDQNTTTTLKNNSTLRNGASGNNVAVPITLFGNVAVDNAATTNITVPTGGETIFAQAFKNTTAAPTGAASQINITGAGIVMLNGNSSIPLAYTGSWNINHGSVGNVTGQTILTAFDSLGVTNTGFAAPVTLTSGYLTDTASDSAHAVPNPITLNGGVLNALANFNSTTRTNAYFSGSINLQSIGGSTIDMSNSAIGDLSGAVCNINLTGPISGNGTLFITAPTTNLQSPGVVTLSNISSATPNTQSGNLIVQYNAALSATTSTGNSNPLGAANISLAGGELLLNHAGAGSNGTITAFANNNITLRGYANGNLATAPTHDGTITLDNAGSANTGNTITLGSLTFDATGTSATQTLAIQNAAGANYKAQFNGLATLNGTATITTGTNPADVILNNKITGPGNLIKAGNNTLTLSGVSSNYTGATTVNAGTLIFNATHQIASLTVNTTSHAVVSSGGNKFLQAGTLAINGTGALDLTDEDAILTNTPIGTVQTYIQSAYNNGPWTGTGLTSTSAQSTAASAHKTALGFATASSINASSFDGQPLTTGSTVLIRYTYSGDANLDGLVNLLDLNALATNFGTPSSTWSQGDFNYDGTVNVMDFNLLASNFGNVLAAPPVSSLPLALGALVPEPASALFIALPLLMMRRRKSNQ